MWPQMRLLLEADMTYRARQLAMGGARLLFADMHPNLRWRDGVLHIGQMISRHTVEAGPRGGGEGRIRWGGVGGGGGGPRSTRCSACRALDCCASSTSRCRPSSPPAGCA